MSKYSECPECGCKEFYEYNTYVCETASFILEDDMPDYFDFETHMENAETIDRLYRVWIHI